MLMQLVFQVHLEHLFMIQILLHKVLKEHITDISQNTATSLKMVLLLLTRLSGNMKQQIISTLHFTMETLHSRLGSKTVLMVQFMQNITGILIMMLMVLDLLMMMQMYLLIQVMVSLISVVISSVAFRVQVLILLHILLMVSFILTKNLLLHIRKHSH